MAGKKRWPGSETMAWIRKDGLDQKRWPGSEKMRKEEQMSDAVWPSLLLGTVTYFLNFLTEKFRPVFEERTFIQDIYLEFEKGNAIS